MKKTLLLTLFMACILMTTACQKENNDNVTDSTRLTVGEAKRRIEEGKTTQGDVLRAFGSPNLVTRNSAGKEVWNYNRMSFDAEAKSSYGTLLLFGGSSATSSAASKSFDLIITYDTYDVVETYEIIHARY